MDNVPNVLNDQVIRSMDFFFLDSIGRTQFVKDFWENKDSFLHSQLATTIREAQKKSRFQAAYDIQEQK